MITIGIRIVGGLLLLSVGVGRGHAWVHEAGWFQSRNMVRALAITRNPDVISSLSDVRPEFTTSTWR